MIDVKKLITGFLILATAATCSGLIFAFINVAPSAAPGAASQVTIAGGTGAAGATSASAFLPTEDQVAEAAALPRLPCGHGGDIAGGAGLGNGAQERTRPRHPRVRDRCRRRGVSDGGRRGPGMVAVVDDRAGRSRAAGEREQGAQGKRRLLPRLDPLAAPDAQSLLIAVELALLE